MKQIIKNSIIAGLLFFAAGEASFAQINTTLETKIVDILAQMPTEGTEHSDRLVQEVLDLGEDGILEFTSRLVPAGKGNDVQARYLVNSLVVFAGQGSSVEMNNLVERSVQKAIESENDVEVKTFLIRRLTFCGTDGSVDFLSTYLEDDQYYKAALSVLESIGTEKAGAAIFNKLDPAEGEKQYALIESLGRMRYIKANEKLIEISDTSDWVSVKYVLRALSEIASGDSYKTLSKASQTAKYQIDDKEAIISLINYGYRLREIGNKELSHKIGNSLLKNCTTTSQLHFRSAGLELLRDTDVGSLNKLLLKEVANEDFAYRGAVLDLADETVVDIKYQDWIKYLGKASEDTKPQIVRVVGKRNNQDVFTKCLEPALQSKNEALRIVAIKSMAHQDKEPAVAALLKKLDETNSEEEFNAVQETLLRIVNSEDAEVLITKLPELGEGGKIVLINVLAERNVSGGFESIANLAGSGTEALDLTVYTALGSVANSDDLTKILQMLDQAEAENSITALQGSAIQVIDGSDDNQDKIILEGYKNASRPTNWMPILVAVEGSDALNLVENILIDGSESEKLKGVMTLANWRNKEAIPVLYAASTTDQPESVRAEAFMAYLMQVVGSDHPDDQKLLLVKRIYPFNKSLKEKTMVIRAAGTLPTFLSLVFVSEFLEDKELIEVASNTAIRIALPTPTFEGLSGQVVRDIVSKSINNLSGQDSQYLKIDVKEFLDNMSNEKGYLPIFNGTDLTGWQGLVEDPIKRSKMSPTQLAKKQSKADEAMQKDWIVENGSIKFIGEGFKNICTIKEYGDVEILLDWKIGEGGDSGVYLRGSPQVQIWDTALTEVGAQVGSGGLYNNEVNQSKPSVVADNPINQWNTFRIKIIDDVVNVYLNGVLVVDQVVLENYWERNMGLFPKGSIELQAHGEDVMFRNVYVKEIGGGAVELAADEIADGFVSLFNGKDLDQWQGNKKDYAVENGELVVKPDEGERGNLYSNEEYSDFVLRFEFQLTPGANNGLGIHAPLEGDVAYLGKESQILDNTAEIYANLEEHQYHGSIYGVIAAKRGFLAPVGEWNSEEVIVKGDDFKIILNGTVILEGNVAEASKNGTLDGKDHPGLMRKKGYLAFLGHGSELRFRNIRIKDLSKE